MWKVLETARNVAEKSRLVRIDRQAVKRFSQNILEEKFELPSWDLRYHFFDGGEGTVFYLLTLDAINFCFWPSKGRSKWRIKYKSETLSGYYALAASLKEAVLLGVPILNPEYLAELSLRELKKTIGGHGELQLMERRTKNLNELGRMLLSEYEGRACDLVESAGKSALKLVTLLTEKLSSFRDVAEYQGHKVFFLKRAQLFASDLYGAFKGQKWGNFKDMDGLTVFADYKLPQVLRQLGVLRYESALMQKVNKKVCLEAGGLEEVEIRANTVWAAELVRQELSRYGRKFRSFEIDWLLWNLGQHKEFKKRPHHRVLTIFY